MNYKKPREIIAAHKKIIALDILADDLRDRKEGIMEAAKATCLESIKKNKRVAKINRMQLYYETGREIRKELISYFKLKEDTTDEEIVDMLIGLLDLVKLQSYLHKKDLGKWNMLSDIRQVIWWYAIRMSWYRELNTLDPDELKKELERVV